MKFEEIVAALRSGKKITKNDDPFLYKEEVKDNYGATGSKFTNIKYFYTNPQFNRMFVMLEDGRTEDHGITLLDIFWNENRICIYDDKKEKSIEELIREIAKLKNDIVEAEQKLMTMKKDRYKL